MALQLTEQATQATLERPGPIPLYRRIKEDLLDKIKAETLKPGDVIPPERELCEHYGVSRITVRRAIGELETSGYIERHQGRGTYVSRTRIRIRRQMGGLISFSEEMRAQGRKPGSKLLNLQHCPADKAIASLLKTEEGEPIWIVERLRLADDEVVSFSVSYLRLPLHIYLTPLELNTESSLWSVLTTKGTHITEGHATVRAMIADERFAQLLGVEVGDPLLVRDGVHYSAEEEFAPVEAFQTVSRADRYQFSLPLVRHLAE